MNKNNLFIWPLDLCNAKKLWVHLSFSQGLADNAVISRVNGELWDLDRPLEQDCSLEILRFDNDDAQAVGLLKFYLQILLLVYSRISDLY